MAALSITLLGSSSVILDGTSLLPMRTTKVQALLNYLVAERVFAPGAALGREQIMTLLWPDIPDSAARKNLRQMLYLLRQALPEVTGADGTVPFLLSNTRSLQVNPQAYFDLDLAAFQELVAAGEPAALAEAVDFYRGDFLQDFYLEDSNEYEEWAADHRAQLRLQALDSLEVLADYYLAQGNYEQAETYARRQITLDPLREEGHRQLIEALARAGRRSAALAAYDDLVSLLERELAVPPALPTQELAAQVRAGTVQSTPHGSGHARGYALQEQIGQGGFGTVYRAIQPAVGRDVAVKAIRRRFANDPDFVRRFETEAQMVGRLEHPHIVPLYDYWREPGGAYLVMRWMRGGSLKEALDNGGWPLEKTLPLLEQIAAALDLAHQRGVIHLDIKPANILLDEAGRAYLTDFGIAREWRNGQDTGSGLAVGSPYYMSPEQVASRKLTPQTDIYSLGLVLYELLAGRRPYAETPTGLLLYKRLSEPLPLLGEVRSELPPAIDAVLQQATNPEPSERYLSAGELASAFRQAVEGEITTLPAVIPPRREVPNPYLGLRAFSEAEAGRFYGREALTAQLVDALRDDRFLVVVGPSGSGKSSVVRAGLLPALCADALPDSGQWFMTDMIPGANPYEALEAALLRVAVNPPPNLLHLLQADENGLVQAAKQLLPDRAGTLLLLVDQFEELYTLVTDDDVRHRFREMLQTAVTDPAGQIRLVLTLRADFYDRPLSTQAFGELVRNHTVVVIPPTEEELARAIRLPAGQAGAGVEETLLTNLVGDVYDQPGALPLLQYALTELFERRGQQYMTQRDYERIGGVQGALANRAEALYQELDETQKPLARQLFLRLVAVGEGASDVLPSPDTRRRVPRSELETLLAKDVAQDDDDPASRAALAAIIDRFGRHRLLTFDYDQATREPTVEVAHEALLIAWPRFQAWIETGRDDLRQQRRLAEWAREWEESDRHAGLLLRSARLDQTASWAAQTDLALSGSEADLLQASIAARQERIAAEEARRQRELETAQRLRQEAEHQRNITFSRELAGSALAVLDDDPELAIMLALMGLDTARTKEATEKLHQALAVHRAERTLVGHEGSPVGVAFNDDGTLLASGSGDNTVRLWDVASGKLLHIFSGYGALIAGLDFDSTGERLATGSYDGTIRIWDVRTGEGLQELVSETFTRWLGIEFSPDGRRLASSGNSQTILWALDTGKPQLIFPDGRNNVAFSPDGRLLVYLRAKDPSVTNIGIAWTDLVVWDLEANEELAVLTNPYDSSGRMSFSPDGKYLAVEADKIIVWNLDLDASETFGQQVASLGSSERTSPASNIAFLPDGKRVIFVGADRQLKIWTIDDPQELISFPGAAQPNALAVNPAGTLVAVGNANDGTIKLCRLDAPYEWQTIAEVAAPDRLNFRDVAFSPDGTRLYTAKIDGTLAAWDATTPGTYHSGEELLLMEVPDKRRYEEIRFYQLEVSSDGRLLATAAYDGNGYLWDAATGRELLRFGQHEDFVWSVALSPDGRYLATGSRDETVGVWDANTGEALYTLSGFGGQVPDVAFSPDGQLLVTGDCNGLIQGWEPDTGERRFRLESFSGIWSLTFSPDGQFMASSGNDAVVRIWDMTGLVEDGVSRLVHEMIGHNALTRGLSFSSNGTRLASASSDNTVRVWDVATGEELLALEVHTDEVWGTAFSPDGKRLATASHDGTVRVFLLDVGELIAAAESRLSRWFTEAECQKYLHTDTCPPPPWEE